ncbi:MAG: YidC/Oxa1 family membrane protein insertase [Planctomycetes bacterium]|nr:YidC/Oxa1 family membrane protein insertase [Planctomycetota bacterium]
MLAIPSPDVLLNLFASAAQALGLLALMLGGGAFVRRRNAVPGPGQLQQTPAWRRYVTLSLLVAVSVAFLLYHLRVVDATNQRLGTNLTRRSTEAQKGVGDTSLKTLSFSAQVQHPRGVSTEQLQQWIDRGDRLTLIDVREPEEIEMGGIAGTVARRYPDLQADPGLVRQAVDTVVLLCESGNRSSELCNWFFEQGLTTHFLIGGYEKWVAEYRPMTGQRSEGSEIRATPDYPQKNLLLDTPDVIALFTKQGAQFVDVRYPEDFALEHLPGAINVPLRKMREAEVEAALRDLPARPIVAVCYDKRSSFYAQILGLRLHRLGGDFRGRYTVPHEFALPVAQAEYVARWQADRAGDTLWGRTKAQAGAIVLWLVDRCGLLGAVVLFALLLRLAMLPFSLLAERDQFAQRQLAPRLAVLKERWQHDPLVLRRESMAALTEAGVSPLRNLVGALLQLVLFTAAFAGVDAAAASGAASPWWLDLSQADRSGIVPVAFAAVMFWFVRLQQQRRTWLVPALFVGVVTALVWQCRAGVQLYLAVSIALMGLQTVLQRRWLARRHGRREPRPAPRRLVPLAQAGDHPDLGNKAVRLGKLLQAGMPVPQGFAVPWGVSPTTEELLAACRRAGIRTAAVRSSAEGEDGAEGSMAGMFLSELDVAPAQLQDAIARVRASYGGRPGGVVVQAFRPADHAGVLFTVDPAHGGRMLAEMVAGCGDALVSGRATPRSFRFGRVSGRPAQPEAPPMPLAQLLELGRAAERLFGRPQDIEWVHVAGGFELVQSRDITRLPDGSRGKPAAIESERRRLLDMVATAPVDEAVLVQSEISALLPTPTAYSLDLFESLWAAGGSVDRAARATGFTYEVRVDAAPLVLTAFGRSYVDRRQWQQRCSKQLGAMASFRMAAAGKSIEEDWRAGQPAQLQRLLLLEAVDARRLGDADLLQLAADVRRTFVEETYVRAETINMAAEYFVGAARSRAQRAGLDAAVVLADHTGTVVSRAFSILGEDRAREDRVHDFLAAFGHRAAHDFELSEARYGEDSGKVFAMLSRRGGRHDAARETSLQTLPKVLQVAIERARRFQVLKEEAKHEAMRDLAVLRRLLLQIGERFELGAGVFDLLPEEVAGLADPARREAARQKAEARAARRRRLLEVELPGDLSVAALEQLGDAAAVATVATGELAGAYVAGSREVVGRVRVLRSVDELHTVVPGEILVARFTDPCWLSAFELAGGLITEVGGWLSHAAIQAREQDLPTIVGVPGACGALRTGELVRLRHDGVIERVAERRQPRRSVDLPATLVLGETRCSIRLTDVGPGGAGILVANPAALPEGTFRLEVGQEVVESAVAWRNCTRAGIRFSAVPAALRNPETKAEVR